MAYKFAKQSEVKELESWCMDILHAVQEEVRDYFTFDIRLIVSGDKRLVTQNSDESFDLDYNIILQRDINDCKEDRNKSNDTTWDLPPQIVITL